ncbi:MAG TPA: AbrB/MazE/SpoVT family DNA-binding domain-containing protein [Caulobacteraceae bacterium]|jgi:antitoxin MazE|nr:AbrB/MazE/SpoVT family DNA-binding domain-containing protein [Caulobacteraceae bacterium]
MRIALRKMGNSSGVIIPKPLLTQIGAQAGGDVDMAVENDRIVIQAIKAGPREGWAEASRAIAEAGEDGLVWPEFANEDDQALSW